jgi:hypothetical protein
MSYDLKINYKDNYIHAEISGIEKLENVLAVWMEIALACKGINFKKVLCEGCLKGSGPVQDIKEFAKYFMETGMPEGK